MVEAVCIPKSSHAVPVTANNTDTAIYNVTTGRVFRLKCLHFTNLRDAQSRVQIFDTTSSGTTAIVDLLLASSASAIVREDELSEDDKIYNGTVIAKVTLATVVVKVIGEESPGED